jgi:hypothetical protein
LFGFFLAIFVLFWHFLVIISVNRALYERVGGPSFFGERGYPPP